MHPHKKPNTIRTRAYARAALAWAIALAPVASANEEGANAAVPTAQELASAPAKLPAAATKESAEAALPCGVLERMDGEVQLLDPSRTKLVDAVRGSALPCGGWVSVGLGWAQVRQRNGHTLHVGRRSFVQLKDVEFYSDGGGSKKPWRHPNAKQKLTKVGDHVVIYKGQVYAQAGSADSELRIVTANARVRIQRGKAVVVYSHEQEETSLSVLGNEALIENRFAGKARMTVKAGEVSHFNPKLERAYPTIPKAVAIASLRPRLIELHVGDVEQSEAIRAARRRQERKFAANLVGDGDAVDPESEARSHKSRNQGGHGPQRKIAGSARQEAYSYQRHQHDANDSVIHSHWVKRIVGGESVGERILFPDKYYGKVQKVTLDVEDRTPRLKMEKRREDEERRKLIEELSQVRVE